MSILHIHLLGDFQLTLDDAAVTSVDTPRLQSLLAYLLLHRDAPQSRQQIAFLFWPDATESQARTNLRNILHLLRQALPQADTFLCIDNSTIQWRGESPFKLDVADFEHAIALNAIDQAIELYRGDLLPSCYDDWILSERERLQEMFLHALDRLIHQAQEQQNYRLAIDYAQRLLRHDPLREETYRLLMRLYALSGNRTGIVRMYDTCVTVLQRELGIEVSSETLAEYERCLKLQPVALEPTPTSQAHFVRHNLPTQLTRFIGRESEKAQVKQLVLAHRLVTLTGAGGVGKTRLAFAVATELVNEFADGVWHIDLAPLSDPNLVVQAVTSTLNVREEAGRPLLARLIDRLQAKHMLLLFDNCEHLVDGVRALAESLLRAAPELRILATSRVVLDAEGEVIWRVPSLSIPDVSHRAIEHHDLTLQQYESVQFFVERATAVLPTFALTNQNAWSVAQICQRLDGIPLALELAAARVKLLTVQQIAERLDNALRLLTQGSATALPRHQTLQATMDWSHALLSEQERILFRRLSVFAGSFSLEAVESICSDDGIEKDQILNRLSVLVDKSLVTVDQSTDETRFRLHEIGRQYAHEKLVAADEEVEMRSRHLEFFLRLAEETEPHLREPSQQTWLNKLDIENGNFRAALASSLNYHQASANGCVTSLKLAIALTGFWIRHNYLSEGCEWLDRVLTATETVDSVDLRAKGFLCALELAYWKGDSTVRFYRDMNQALFDRLTNECLIAESLFWQGHIAFIENDFRAAESYLETSLTIFRKLRNKQGIANSLRTFAHLKDAQGDLTAAYRFYSESTEIYRDLGDTRMVGKLLRHLGRVNVQQGKYFVARTLYQEGLSLTKDAGDEPGTMVTLNSLGELARAEREYDQARNFYEESLALSREQINFKFTAWNLAGLGYIALHVGNYEQAYKLIKEGLVLSRKVNLMGGIVDCLAKLAGVIAYQGKTKQAALLFGATNSVREKSSHDIFGFTFLPTDYLDLENNLSMVRTQLDEATFNAAWAAGRAMTMDEAIAYALEETDK